MIRWASCSWLLLRHLAKMVPSLDSPILEEEDDDDEAGKIHLSPLPIDYDHSAEIVAEENTIVAAENILAGEPEIKLYENVILPGVSYDDARRIMTRTDFFEGLDIANVSHSARVDGPDPS